MSHSIVHLIAEALPCAGRRLEQLQKQFKRGEVEQVAWLDGLTWKEIEKLRTQVVPVPTHLHLCSKNPVPVNARIMANARKLWDVFLLSVSIPLPAWSVMTLGVRRIALPHRAAMPAWF